ncbi:hypothetical protein BDU57DRAFT_560717 [Ampelomyces quisqualis]|uniref:Uncharacterized protein n=1 Tax=Ampelomyces quisqualis TaxID=50730 RepID=A0A6A5Q9B8_AMPQU|nr:hypothetical protein BDU57DRAFT_560717 [Ampelomyces quisqualis]
MSNSPSSRGSARGTSKMPTTPDQTCPTIPRASSFSVAPKSEYLKNALQEVRRAQQSTTPSPMDKRAAPPAPTKSPQTRPPAISPDIFDELREFELSEEQTRPVSPIRRRRPSGSGLPQTKTARELAEENEKLREANITTNLRVQLLSKKNVELEHENTKLKTESDLLENKSNELNDENNELAFQIKELEEEMDQLRDDNTRLQKSNEELLAITEESSLHWDGQEKAVKEAAEAIYALELEKAALADEVQDLKQRVSLLECDSAKAGALVDGSPRCPSRVYSIDEASPSTSHFDSDYYSQPDSPVVKPSRSSVISITPSERSQKFLDSTQERRRSARDLAKRMSMASLAALRASSPASIPEVPQIPTVFQKQMSQIIERPSILQDALAISPTMPLSSSPRSPALRSDQSDRSTQYRSSGDSSSSHNMTPTIATRPRYRRPSIVDVSPRTPKIGAEEWGSLPPPPNPARSSIISQSSLTSESDLRDKDRWWKNLQPLTQQSQPAPPQPIPQPQHYPAPPQLPSHGTRPSDGHNQSYPQSPTLTRSKSHHPGAPGPPAKLDSNGTSSESSKLSLRNDAWRTRTQPSTPSATTPKLEKDFLFNASEDADAFIKKTRKLGFRK